MAPIQTCVPSAPRKPVYFGNNPISNRDGQAHITRVTLSGNQGLELVNAFLVPVKPLAGGDLASLHPSRSKAWDWAAAQPAVGATVSGESPPLDLVVEVETSSGGRSKAIQVEYDIDHDQYATSMPNSLEMRTTGDC